MPFKTFLVLLISLSILPRKLEKVHLYIDEFSLKALLPVEVVPLSSKNVSKHFSTMPFHSVITVTKIELKKNFNKSPT